MTTFKVQYYVQSVLRRMRFYNLSKYAEDKRKNKFIITAVSFYITIIVLVDTNVMKDEYI